MDLKIKYVTRPDGTKTLTIPDDRRALAISFVREGATRTSRQIEAIVQEGHDALLAALADVSESQAKHKPGPEDWSILQLMDHVVTIKQGMATLCRHLGEGHLPPGFGPQFEEARAQDGLTVVRFETLAPARAAAQAAHDDLLGLIRGFDAGVNTEVRFTHFVFGAFNSREWAVFQHIHDGDHAPHIGKIKASAGYPTG